jgi:hypothetical protein
MGTAYTHPGGPPRDSHRALTTENRRSILRSTLYLAFARRGRRMQQSVGDQTFDSRIGTRYYNARPHPDHSVDGFISGNCRSGFDDSA